MSEDPDRKLSKREQQIMDICLRKEPLNAREVWEAMPDQPSYATVRKQLTILVEKEELKRQLKGRTFVYRLARSRKTEAKSAARRLVETFYRGSLADAVMGLLGTPEKQMSPEELERISKMIEEAKSREGQS